MHVNKLELLAVKLTLQTFLKDQKLFSVHIEMDNVLVLTYLKNIGERGTQDKKMTKTAKEFWEMLLSHGITITVEYLPCALNKLADQKPRWKIGKIQN